MYEQEKITPYNHTEGKTEQVEKMFDGIARSYDLLNHLLSFGIDKRWRKKTIQVLSRFPHEKILDIATGTGDFALLTCQMLRPSRLTACDISEGMMEIGKKKALEAGLNDIISFQKEDCTRLSFRDNQFDIITVAYGVRNFAHLDKGLEEMHRVLKPGGHLAILELCVPDTEPMKSLFRIYSHVWMPLLGRLISKDKKAYSYLPATMEAFPQGEIMKGIIQKAGFKDVYFKRYSFGLSTMYIATKQSS